MKILLSNDDGYRAPGLGVMRAALQAIAEVVVVAPQTNCSGSSNALTLRRPIAVEQVEDAMYAVDGTPADCVHLAVNGMLDFEPDLVVSGINNGENLGDDVMYSGTVAAAIEGRFLRLPAIAVSLAGAELKHFDTAARVVMDKLERMLSYPLAADCLLNINVPDLPYDEIMGMEVTRCGNRNHSEPIIPEHGASGVAYRIGPPGVSADDGEGTDFHAVRNHRVSVTPISIDMTHRDRMGELSRWLQQ